MNVPKICLTCFYCCDPFLDIDIMQVPKDYKLICANPEKHKDIVLEEFAKEDGVTLFKYLCGGQEVEDKHRCDKWKVNQGVVNDYNMGWLYL